MAQNKGQNNNMMQAMAQAMAQGNAQEFLQAMAQAMFLQGMAQGNAQGKAQAQQEKAQAVQAWQDSLQGKAQAKGKGKAQAQGMAWERIERQNERHTVWAVRQAMVQGKPFDSLVKAWIVLNEKAVPADDRVRKVCEDMRCACLHAKEMSVKNRADKHAHFEVASMVTVKRAFYCAMRGMPIVETRQDTEPAMRGKKAQGK